MRRLSERGSDGPADSPVGTSRSTRVSVVLTTATTVVSLICATVGGVATARVLGPVGRGEFAVLVVWASVLQAGSTLGVPHSYSYLLARGQTDRRALVGYVHRVAVRLAFLGTGFVAILFVTFQILGKVDEVAAAIFLLWVPAATISVFATSYFHGVGQFGKFNAIRLIAGAGTGIILVSLATADMLTVRSAAFAYAVAAMGGAVAGSVLVWRDLGGLSPVDRLQNTRPVWIYARGNLFALISTSTNNRADQLALSFLVESAHLGSYAVAATSSTIVAPLTSGLAVIGFNRIASIVRPRDQVALIARLAKVTAVTAGAAAGLFGLFAGWLIPFVYGDRFAAAVVPARILAVGSIFLATSYVVEEALRGRGLPGIVGWAEALGAITTVVGVVVARNSGLAAMAIASSFGYFVTMVYAIYHVTRVGDDPQ